MTLGGVRLLSAQMTPEAPTAKPQSSVSSCPAILFDETLRRTLEDLIAGFSGQVAVVDENWTVLCANSAWKRMIEVGGYPQLSPGTDYREFLEVFAAKGHENAKLVLAGIRAIDKGQTDSFELTYAGVDTWAGRTLNFRIHRAHFEGYPIATLARQDVTDSIELDRLRQSFDAAVVRTETEARQRLTRELHDSTGQLLTAISLLLATATKEAKSPRCTPIFDEVQDLLRQATQEIRSMSYLSQRPDLAEIGIVDALKALATGFGARSKLDISFRVLGTRVRLIPAVKTAVYRVAQEALSNVHRHARAKHVQMSLVFRKSTVHVIIADDGIGVSDETLAGKGTPGVGIAGMRSRLAEIGGRFSVRRLRQGTAVVASVPLHLKGMRQQPCAVPYLAHRS